MTNGGSVFSTSVGGFGIGQVCVMPNTAYAKHVRS